MPELDQFPLPALEVDDQLKIRDYNHLFQGRFGKVQNLIDAVDVESRGKAQRFFHRETERLELNLLSEKGAIVNCQLHIKWLTGSAIVTFIEQDERLERLGRLVTEHKRQLDQTDLELLIKNKELEESRDRIQELSVAMIQLSENKLLMPVFGDMDGTLLAKNKTRILDHVYTSAVDIVVMDLQSVRVLNEEGIINLKNLIRDMKLMGADTLISGVKPHHASILNRHGMLQHARFINTLQETLKSII